MRVGWVSLCIVLCLALVGCETVRVVEVDPARFVQQAPASAEPAAPLPGRVALVMAPTVLQTERTGDRQRAVGPVRLRWPAGSLVEAALLGALTQQFSEGAQRVDAPPDGGFVLVVRVTEVEISDDDRLRLLIPIPIPGAGLLTIFDTSLHLSFDLQLLDERAQALWTRRYDSGRVVWKPPRHTAEVAVDGLVRLAHETAWRLATQAAQDLRVWVENDRLAPRQL